MRLTKLLTFLLLAHFSFAQQFNSLFIERKNIDANNLIYQTGRLFVFDYEIIENDKKYKLSYNEGYPNEKFELVYIETDTLDLKIHLLVPKPNKSERTNKKQTEIKYLYGPVFKSINGTGIVENEKNTWIHPPRQGFFKALETCPFPFVSLPLEIGKQWNDKMKISNHWSHEKWGAWEKKLMLSYNYKITERTVIETGIGNLDCYVIESSAESRIGESRLRSYYSEKYGFVRMEYEMVTGLKVNIWLDRFSENNNFNDLQHIINYRNEQRNNRLQ